MSPETISLLLSVAGLILGFISAYSQLKAFAIRVLRLGGDTAKRWLLHRDEQTAMHLAYPSAFVGYVTNRITFIVMLIALRAVLPTALMLGHAPTWLVSSVKFIIPLLGGLLLGALSSASAEVIAAARKARMASSSEG